MGSPKQKFIQLGIETYFSFNNMPQTVLEIKHSIKEEWLKNEMHGNDSKIRYVTCVSASWNLSWFWVSVGIL